MLPQLPLVQLMMQVLPDVLLQTLGVPGAGAGGSRPQAQTPLELQSSPGVEHSSA